MDKESTVDKNDLETNVAGVRREKTWAKTAFTTSWRILPGAFTNSFTPSEINDFTAALDDRMTDVQELLDSLAFLLELQNNDLAVEKVSDEVEKIEEEYSSAQN